MVELSKHDITADYSNKDHLVFTQQSTPPPADILSSPKKTQFETPSTPMSSPRQAANITSKEEYPGAYNTYRMHDFFTCSQYSLSNSLENSDEVLGKIIKDLHFKGLMALNSLSQECEYKIHQRLVEMYPNYATYHQNIAHSVDSLLMHGYTFYLFIQEVNRNLLYNNQFQIIFKSDGAAKLKPGYGGDVLSSEKIARTIHSDVETGFKVYLKEDKKNAERPIKVEADTALQLELKGPLSIIAEHLRQRAVPSTVCSDLKYAVISNKDDETASLDLSTIFKFEPLLKELKTICLAYTEIIKIRALYYLPYSLEKQHEATFIKLFDFVQKKIERLAKLENQ